MVALQILVLSVQVRILVSQQKSHNSLYHNDLDNIPHKNGSKTGQARGDPMSNRFFSLYDALRELCKEKKMMFFKPTLGLEYIPAKISKGKEWYVYFYVADPTSGALVRVRKKINRIKNLKERLKAGRQMVISLNERLALGWNPLTEKIAPKGGADLFEAVDAYIKSREKSSEYNSFRCYLSFAAKLKAWISAHGARPGKFPVMSFTRQLAIEYMNDIERDEKIGAQTYNNYLRQNKLIFSWLKEKGYIPDNPFDGMKGKSKRSIKKIRRNMTDDEMSRLFAFLKEINPNYLALCLMCYCCLIRPKEIALLKCEDIDLQKQTVHIRADIAKNDNESYRTIPDDMMPFISALDLSDPKAYVFSDTPDWSFRPGKKQLKTQYIARYWGDVVRKECGFPMELKFYSLKDSGITNMLGSGVPVSFVKQQADHSSLAMTSIYLGKSPNASEELKKTHIIK